MFHKKAFLFFLLIGSITFASLPSGPNMPCPFSAFATNYEDCAASCYDYYAECDIGACIDECQKLFGEVVPEDTNEIPNNLCEGVVCEAPYCEGNQIISCGCEETTGECICSAFWCAEDCDPATAQCIEKEKNTISPTIEILDDPGYVVLNDYLGQNTLHLFVFATYPDGSPAKNARVHIRLTDPENTGIVGPWGFGDAVLFTDSTGTASGELEFPTLRNVKEYYWDRFPYPITMEVTVSKHDNSNDWSVTKTSQIEVKTPAPRITEISINPNPSQSGEKHQVRVVVDDPDSNKLTYVFSSCGGSWSTHAHALEGSTSTIYGFTSESHTEVLEWTAPVRGLTKDELFLAKEMLANIDGTRINLKFTMTEEIMKMYPKFIMRLESKLATDTAAKFLWVAPGVNTAKSIYGLWGNTKNLAVDVDGLMKSVSWKEGLYKSMDLGLEGAKTTIGVLTLGGKEIPILGGLASATQDLVDALVGTVQAKLNHLAALERIREAEPMVEETSLIVTVRDSDGFYDKEYYSFDMEYLGFKPEEGG